MRGLRFAIPQARVQFLIEFPHDKHQDVIAQLNARPVTQTVSLRSWAHARLVAAADAN